MTAQQQAALLYNNWILDVPKLLDIASLYMDHNSKLTNQLMHQVFEMQPLYASDLESAAAVVAANVADVQRTCSAAVERLEASFSASQLQGLTDGLTYLADTCSTLSHFCRAYPPAAPLFAEGQNSLMPALSSIFENLVPKAAKIWSEVHKKPSERQLALLMQQALANLESGLQTLTAALLSGSYLHYDKLLGNAVPRSKQFAGASERGTALLSALKMLSGQNSLLKATQRRFQLDQLLADSIQKGHTALTSSQQAEALALLGASQTSSAARLAQRSCNEEQEEALKQIREVLPGYGDGFLTACLDALGQNAERVIHHILEGSLPAELAKLDPQMPLPSMLASERSNADGSQPATSTSGSGWREMQELESAAAAARISAGPQLQGSNGPSKVHKGTAFAMRASPQDTALAKLHAQAAQWEYDDEYDDSFDDLAAFEADPGADTQGDRTNVAAESSTAQPQRMHVKPKGGNALWVLNGRIYNYRKEGATPVPSQAAAEEAVRAQRAAAQDVHGLGAGGNKPVRPSEEGPAGASRQADAAPLRASAIAPGRNRGRGGGRAPPSDARRSHAFKSEHKADIANHHRKDRALRKQGGPAS